MCTFIGNFIKKNRLRQTTHSFIKWSQMDYSIIGYFFQSFLQSYQFVNKKQSNQSKQSSEQKDKPNKDTKTINTISNKFVFC